MRTLQASFSSGEISPVLHARVDLARYQTGLAKLENMLVMPQGGVKRRNGFKSIGSMNGGRLIPFEYSTTDSALIELGDKTGYVWSTSGLVTTFTTPYTGYEALSVKYVQSGNVIFMVHKNHKPQMLRRNSQSSWSMSELNIRNGPFIDGEEWASGVTLLLVNTLIAKRVTAHSTGTVFNSNLVGSLMKVEYSVNARSQEIESDLLEVFSDVFEVKGTINVMTSGDWTGTVRVYRSVDGGENWTVIRQYHRTDQSTQGQWDFTMSEAEENVLYKVSGQNEELVNAADKPAAMVASLTTDEKKATSGSVPITITLDTSNVSTGNVNVETTEEVDVTVREIVKQQDGTTISPMIGFNAKREKFSGQVSNAITFTNPTVSVSGDTSGTEEEENTQTFTVSSTNNRDDTPATITISVSGFLKSAVYKIVQVNSSQVAVLELQDDSGATPSTRVESRKVTLWSMGAWGGSQGYPSVVSMFQDRLVFANTAYQPQTIWMSRTGDYADFGTSDPLRDDDAVSLTLAGSRADSIHSLIASTDLLAFTSAGEWRIKGAGDAGAITPGAITAHEQTTIGSTPNISPILVNGRIIFVQTQRKKIYALGYDLNVDGYTGSELSIMSSHMFQSNPITSIAYQAEPDSVIWITLTDGTMAACTYNPEHEVIGFSRHSNSDVKFQRLCAVCGNGQTEIYAFAMRGGGGFMLRLKHDSEGGYDDAGTSFDSTLRTLRVNVNGETGSAYPVRKFIARVSVYALGTTSIWVYPCEWERRRVLEFMDDDGMRESELQLDNGYDLAGTLELRSNDGAMTILGISPQLTVGG